MPLARPEGYCDCLATAGFYDACVETQSQTGKCVRDLASIHDAECHRSTLDLNCLGFELEFTELDNEDLAIRKPPVYAWSRTGASDHCQAGHDQ